jgi:hypothetical protein
MDGTLLEAWAGMKSFQRKDGKTPPYDPGNATVDRHRRRGRTKAWKLPGPSSPNRLQTKVDVQQRDPGGLRFGGLIGLLLVWDRLPANAGKG